MRVAIVQSETRFMGGIERVTEGILAHGDWQGIEWYVIFLRPGLMVDRIRRFHPVERTAVFEAGRLRSVGRSISTVAAMARQLRRWNIDVVLSQGFHSQCYGGAAAKLAGIPNVFWCHGFLRPEVEGRNSIVRVATHMPTAAVIGGPRSNLPNLNHYFAQRCPVRLVYPAQPLMGFTGANGEAIRSEFNLDSHAPVIANIGRLQCGKGQDVFIRAADILVRTIPQARFLIVGGPSMAGDDAYEQSLKEAVRELGLEDRVIFTGERHDIPELIAAADVIVSTSTQAESFGLVIVEAMTAGKPVIATNHGGPADIIEDGVSGLLTTPGNEADLAGAIARVLQDRELAARLGRNGMQRVREHFSFEQMVASLTAVLEEAASRKVIAS
jgi:glycosyltransferase involved in cell wall biosynthesis